MSLKEKKGILERLNAGDVIIGDGGFCHALEKRCYVKAGDWTPECVIEFPDAVRQLHREFLRAGADVMQAFTFSKVDGELVIDSKTYQDVNKAACELANQVASEGSQALFAGSICQSGRMYRYKQTTKEQLQQKFKEQVDVFVQNKVDFFIAEFFENVQEAEWVLEVIKASGKPVAVTMAIGVNGDLDGVSPGDCAVRLVRAGADIIGVNCRFDPEMSLKTMQLMIDAAHKENLKVHFMVQPYGYLTPDANELGAYAIPECPFALEPRLLTRWDCHKYARKAYDMGIRYVGGCCGFVAYHIRALAEELSKERGRLPPGSSKHGLWGEGLGSYSDAHMNSKANRGYWENLQPATGRPFSPSLSTPEIDRATMIKRWKESN